MRRWLAGAAALMLGILTGMGALAEEGAESVVQRLIAAETAGVPDETETPAEPGERKNPEATDAPADSEQTEGIRLRLEPVTATAFTHVVAHYVRFNVTAAGAEKLILRVYKPGGKQISFRTKQLALAGKKAVKAVTQTLEKEQKEPVEMNVLFPSGSAAGEWTIRVTAEAQGLETAQAEIPVNIRKKDPLTLGDLEEARSLVTGYDSDQPVAAEAGKIRYVSQLIRDEFFVKEYWLSKGHDLREIAKGKCTRALFSMALSYLGIDCTPVDMSDMLKAEVIFYTYDDVCEKLGGIERQEADLETLWAEYEKGNASPVMVHFNYTYEEKEGMHAALLIARDSNVPELFYALMPGQKTNTSRFPGGMKNDPIVPILIDLGEVGQWIQTPLLPRYHKGRIDKIWSWRTN